jgi:hypothetical protein
MVCAPLFEVEQEAVVDQELVSADPEASARAVQEGVGEGGASVRILRRERSYDGTCGGQFHRVGGIQADVCRSIVVVTNKAVGDGRPDRRTIGIHENDGEILVVLVGEVALDLDSDLLAAFAIVKDDQAFVVFDIAP